MEDRTFYLKLIQSQSSDKATIVFECIRQYIVRIRRLFKMLCQAKINSTEHEIGAVMGSSSMMPLFYIRVQKDINQ